MGFGYEASLRLIAESLRLVDRLGADPIAATDVRMDDGTLVIEMTARATDTIRVKAEIAGVMGALAGLDVPTTFPSLGVQRFGVRAHAATGEEIMWIISSVEAAGFAARGQPIEWLSHSVVQENTSDYRRAQADRKVESLEIALRDLTHTHAERRFGAGYISQLWDDTAEMRRAARREDRDADDPRSLLDFVYLSSLGAAIRDHVEWFSDGCVPDVEQFSQAIVQLNKIRRKLAHNRPISDVDLRGAREASECLMAPIGHAHPELAQDFLVDRWEQRVDEIVGSMHRDFGAPQVPDRGAVPELTRHSAAVAALRAKLAAIEVAIDELDSVVVPDARRELHLLANAALHRLRRALSEMLTVARNPSLNAADAEEAADAFRAALGEVGELRARIQSVRLGTDTPQRDSD